MTNHLKFLHILFLLIANITFYLYFQTNTYPFFPIIFCVYIATILANKTPSKFVIITTEIGNMKQLKQDMQIQTCEGDIASGQRYLAKKWYSNRLHLGLTRIKRVYNPSCYAFFQLIIFKSFIWAIQLITQSVVHFPIKTLILVLTITEVIRQDIPD